MQLYHNDIIVVIHIQTENKKNEKPHCVFNINNH